MLRAFLLATLAASGLAAQASFGRDVRPVLAERCQTCHQGAKPAGGVSVTEPATVSRFAAQLLDAVSGPEPRMPKVGAKLTANEVARLRQWVREGAQVEAGQEEAWWSLRPLPVKHQPGTIDGFIRARLQANGLAPSPAADRRTLIRRVTFDLHGLPPTPEEVRAFEADNSPKAYDRLVNRLLDSPRYGERWARHWLDVAHYGESHGYDKDKPRMNAWPYRDWVIQALNEDKPYVRFVQEQIAGDILFPETPQAVTATGFLAAGPWDFVGHQELREGTTDKAQTRLLDRDDMVAATMSTFVSMTAHCARCHDHKFDPIPQADYYRLQAVFAGVDRADRPYDDEPAVHRQRQELLTTKRQVVSQLQPLLDKVENATSPEFAEVDARLKDARFLLTHLGEPKTPAEVEQKKVLQARADEATKRRQQLLDALVGKETYAAIDVGKAKLKAVNDGLAALPAPKQVYAAASFFDRVGNFRPPLVPREIHLLNRGSVTAPGVLMKAGALSCVPALTSTFEYDDEGARRAGLARWITASGNVLTWRSIVNRVWHYHFGAGIVDSPNDFGRMGGKPSHPELLDWLAVWFRDEAQGSLKKLHRLILLSDAYQQSSANRADAAKVDADNRLLWRMNRGRLDAESVRDAVLSVAGQLDLKMGGPSVQMFWFKNDHSPVYDYARFDPATPGANRRSIYRFIVRSVADPFFDRLDCPDPSVLAPKRSTTLTAIQALALWNNPFMVRMAGQLAARAQTLEEAVELVWQRPPTPAERERFAEYEAKHGRASLARLLFNTNEFLFLD